MSKVKKLVANVNPLDNLNLVENFLVFSEVQGLGKDSLRSQRYALSEFFELYDGALTNVAEVKKVVSQMLQGKQDARYRQDCFAN